jgi:hypothetical protein
MVERVVEIPHAGHTTPPHRIIFFVSALAQYCAISFNSARVVTCDPKYRFGTSAINEARRDTSKNSAYKTKIFENSPFFAPPRRFGPDVTHFTFGTGRCDL